MNTLKDLNTDPKNINGHSMDGAGNMRGNENFGQKESPYHIYVVLLTHISFSSI